MGCCSGSGRSWNDDWLPADLCADLDDDDCDCSGRDRHDCSGDESGSEGDCGCGHHRRPRKRRAIPVNNVSIDCRPVTFRTPGQAINVVSCPVSQVLHVPVTQTTNVQVPLPNGCVLNVPQTEQVLVPVVATVNTPPVQTPSIPSNIIFG